MKARPCAIVIFLLIGTALSALPKVAVLDAVLAQGMDPNISIGVTEKISEELVKSGKYTVLDRTTVGESLKEIEFQMSGLVSDADIQKAGKELNSRLGANYVVVARVSLIERTYFISAKLIDILTGQITAQASNQAEGGAAITFQIAQAVGQKLATGSTETAAVTPETQIAPAPETPVTTEPETPAAKTPPATTQAETPPEPPRLKSHLVLNYIFPGVFGAAYDYIMTSYGYTDTSPSGWTLHYMQSFASFLYISLSIDAVSEDTPDSYNLYSAVDFTAGLGAGFPLGNFMIYAGGMIGYQDVILGDYWIQEGDSQGDLCWGAELGVDWVLFDFLPVSMRITYTDTVFSEDGMFMMDDDFGVFGVSFGVGLSF
jgi:TolB-like protein